MKLALRNQVPLNKSVSHRSCLFFRQHLHNASNQRLAHTGLPRLQVGSSTSLRKNASSPGQDFFRLFHPCAPSFNAKMHSESPRAHLENSVGSKKKQPTSPRCYRVKPSVQSSSGQHFGMKCSFSSSINKKPVHSPKLGSFVCSLGAPMIPLSDWTSSSSAKSAFVPKTFFTTTKPPHFAAASSPSSSSTPPSSSSTPPSSSSAPPSSSSTPPSSSSTPPSSSSTPPSSPSSLYSSRKYGWIEKEAQTLINEAYKLHMRNSQTSGSFPPGRGLSSKDLESPHFSKVPHYSPQCLSDRIALQSSLILEKFMNLFFRTKYDHHAVTLETVASVPGFVAAMHRHLRSLRRMQRDHGWIEPLLEESLNERMHLLIFMQHCQPDFLERAFVVVAQVFYVIFYWAIYTISPRTAHRMVAYFEECAHRAYNEFLEALQKGDIPNPELPANSIAAKFYSLPAGSTLYDVVLRVRADEIYHGLYQHGLADSLDEGKIDDFPVSLEDDLKRGTAH